jgi:hypothetical protein
MRFTATSALAGLVSIACPFAAASVTRTAYAEEKSREAPPPLVGAAPASASASASSSAAAQWPLVKIESSKTGAALYRRDETKKLIDHRGSVDDVWEFVCYAPCNKRVDPESTYRVLGATIPPSDAFTIGTDDATLKVDAGSTRLQLLARGFGGLGIATVVASGVFFVAQGATDNQNKEESLRILGQVFLVSGLTLAITSIVLDSLGNTSVKIEGGGEPKHGKPERPASGVAASSGVRVIPFGFAF